MIPRFGELFQAAIIKQQQHYWVKNETVGWSKRGNLRMRYENFYPRHLRMTEKCCEWEQVKRPKK